MNSSQRELYELAKKLLIFSGKNKKITAAQKKKIVPQLESTLKKLTHDLSPLSKKIQVFIGDILDDITHDRPIDIDSISEDNYIENFCKSEEYVLKYNSCLKQWDYRELQKGIVKADTTITKKILKDLHAHIKKVFSEMDAKDFSSVLCIMNIFEFSDLLTHYKYLYELAVKYSNPSSAKLITAIINIIQKFHTDIHIHSIGHMKKWNLETKYMLCNIKKNTLSFEPVSVVDQQSIHTTAHIILFKNFPI